MPSVFKGQPLWSTVHLPGVRMLCARKSVRRDVVHTHASGQPIGVPGHGGTLDMCSAKSETAVWPDPRGAYAVQCYTVSQCAEGKPHLRRHRAPSLWHTCDSSASGPSGHLRFGGAHHQWHGDGPPIQHIHHWRLPFQRSLCSHPLLSAGLPGLRHTPRSPDKRPQLAVPTYGAQPPAALPHRAPGRPRASAALPFTSARPHAPARSPAAPRPALRALPSVPAGADWRAGAAPYPPRLPASRVPDVVCAPAGQSPCPAAWPALRARAPPSPAPARHPTVLPRGAARPPVERAAH
jgi:hypothetical protein